MCQYTESCRAKFWNAVYQTVESVQYNSGMIYSVKHITMFYMITVYFIKFMKVEFSIMLEFLFI
jgi:hypothetical protein